MSTVYYEFENIKIIQCIMARVCTIIILLFSVQNGLSQPTEYDIKIGGDYHWGEAVSENRSEAVSLARADLINRIVTVVVADQIYDITEDDEEFSTFYQSASRTISRMELRGLDHLVKERPDGTYGALAYIHEEDYERSIDVERERQTEFAEFAMDIEREDGLNQAIPWYYRAFLNTYYFPEPLYLTDDSGRSIEARQFYRRKLDQWAGRIQIEIGRPSGGLMPGNVLEVSIPLKFTVQNHAASPLDVGFDLAGYGTRRTISGSTELYLERLPGSLSETFTLRFRPALEDTRSNRDWQVLAAETGPYYRRTITVDFSPMIRIDFTARPISDHAWRFNSRIENINITHVEWDFGDGTYSNELDPAHTFDEPEPPPRVTLTVNRNSDLQVVKKVTASGLESVREFGEEPPLVSADRERPDPDVARDADRAEVEPASAPFRWRDLNLPAGKRAFLQEISKVEDSGEILRSLQTHGRRLDIRYGNSSAVRSTDDSFVAIVDPESYEIVAFLTPSRDGRRTELHSGKRVINLAETYRGMGSVWIEP